MYQQKHTKWIIYLFYPIHLFFNISTMFFVSMFPSTCICLYKNIYLFYNICYIYVRTFNLIHDFINSIPMLSKECPVHPANWTYQHHCWPPFFFFFFFSSIRLTN